MSGRRLLLRRGGDTLLACAAMLIVALLLSAFEYVQLDHRQREDLRTQADLVGRTAAAALLFEDAGEATHVLGAFEAAATVRMAQLQLPDGRRLATFERQGPEGWLERHGGVMAVDVPVQAGTGVAGRLQVQAWRAGTWRALALVTGAALAIMVLSLAVVALASQRQRAQLRAADARTHYLAHHDVLTGLANRERFAAGLAQAAAGGGALMVLDVDDFKLVNDNHGHAAGDAVLRAVAQRLQSLVRERDLVGRLGGDEFALLLHPPVDAAMAAAVAQRIVEQLPRRIEFEGRGLQVSLSVGLALMPDDARDAEGAMACADMAMYQAKRTGKASWSRYSPALGEAQRERLQLEQALRMALARGEFELAYQPVFDARGRAAGMEALARWHCAERGDVGPARFIPVMEEAGLLPELGLALLQRLRRDLDAWAAQGLSVPPVALNLGARQVRQAALRERFLQRLQALRLTPQEVEFELTESTVFEDLDSPGSIVRALQARGYRLAIDDFGTGYSSLAYLLRMRCAKLKIDRVFVDGVAHREDAALLVQAMVRVAHALGMRVVAEGVERAEDQQRLLALDCDLFQGFGLARPLCPEGIAALLRAGRPVTLAAGAPAADGPAP